MRQGLFDHHRLDLLPLTAVATGGAPIAQGFLGPVPQGYCWYVENVGWAVGGNSHTAELNVAIVADDGPLPGITAWDRAGLVGLAAAATRGVISPALPWFAGAGHVPHFYLAPGSLANGDTVVVTVQIAVHQIDPQFIMSPEDALQVREAHERLGAELARSAVAERRAV
jgi:hypothetical protein